MKTGEHEDFLAVGAFMRLRQQFRNEDGMPVRFHLREKRNTQDDPFDEFLSNEVFPRIPGATCVRSPGPLITPDLALFQPVGLVAKEPGEMVIGSSSVLAIEVKKLERTTAGSVARASGLDYNTTPPCGKVRVYDSADAAVDVRCFYLFVCLETVDNDRAVTALSLVDGDILNADFDFYLSIVGERSKQIDLGTYKDGANRARPMLIFSNPLGIRQLDRRFTLIHKSPELAERYDSLVAIHRIVRSTDQESALFHCYCYVRDEPVGRGMTTLVDPFVVPKRDTRTQPRGKFRLPFLVRAQNSFS